MTNRIYFGDNLPILKSLPDASVDLIYIDPPFNTGKKQGRTRIQTVRAEEGEEGDRIGFGGQRYRTIELGSRAYNDQFDDFLGFIEPRLIEAYRLLKPTGSLYFHIDYREVHYCKVLLDQIFGRDAFINEIIWAYDYGGRSKKRWPAKHDNILFYARDPEQYTFNYEEVERIPYMAPGLVSKEKAERGKFPTDTWWHTIVATNGTEKTGYPTQKPLGVLRRILQASANPGDVVLDFFAGSGTTGEAALERGCEFILIDNNPESIEVMKKRFADVDGIEWGE
ncbi:MAG: site-specific DNA-methyltransferase [Anaerolineaceae bacterium]|nr:site-specific DNA-methyltransferase [Anaerolineaceae bacterium]